MSAAEQRSEISHALWHLHRLFDSIEETYEQTGGEVTDTTEWLEKMVESDVVDLIDALFAHRVEMETRKEMLGKEIERLRKAQQRCDMVDTWCADMAKLVLEKIGKRKIETPTRTVYLVTGKPRIEEIPGVEVDISLADERFVRTKTEQAWKRDELLRAAKAGEPIPECFRLGRSPTGVQCR